MGIENQILDQTLGSSGRLTTPAAIAERGEIGGKIDPLRKVGGDNHAVSNGEGALGLQNVHEHAFNHRNDAHVSSVYTKARGTVAEALWIASRKKVSERTESKAERISTTIFLGLNQVLDTIPEKSREEAEAVSNEVMLYLICFFITVNELDTSDKNFTLLLAALKLVQVNNQQLFTFRRASGFRHPDMVTITPEVVTKVQNKAVLARKTPEDRTQAEENVRETFLGIKVSDIDVQRIRERYTANYRKTVTTYAPRGIAPYIPHL